MSKKIDMLKKLAADQTLDPASRSYALTLLGAAYGEGDGVKKNHEAAFGHWNTASLLGHAQAQCRVGYCYFDGVGVQKNLDKAFEWFHKAASQCHKEGQYLLGIYYDHVGTERNYKQAFSYFKKAADQGYAIAQYNLGNYYQHGKGVAQSLKEAKRCYKLASKQGLAPAHTALAQLEAASGKDADIRKTQKHLNKARKALAAACSSEAVFSNEKRVVQHLYEKGKLASLFRCHNESCSVAYSEDASVQSVDLKACRGCRKVAYCSVKCQLKDWKDRHKKECPQAGADGGDESTAKGGM